MSLIVDTNHALEIPEVHHMPSVNLHVASQEGDDEAAERWMQQARDRKGFQCDDFDAKVCSHCDSLWGSIVMGVPQ